MKIDWNKKYTTISVYAFLVICASIIFFSIIGEIDAFTTKLGWVVSTLQPFIIGFVMSYLFNFILVFYEEKVLVFDLVKNLKKKSKRGISIVLTYLTVFFIIALFMQFVLPQLVDSIAGLVNDVPTYVSNATKLIEEDKSFEEIVDILEKIKKRIIFYGVLENLDNAIKSERISPLTGKIVGALNFNVIINIGNNVVKPIGTVKGYDTALASIQNLVFDRIGDVSKKSLFIGHANNLPKAIIMKNIMTKYNEFESVHIVEVGASIGTYTGEGAILVSVL